MAQQTEVPRAIVERLRTVCLDLPEAYEEQAWVGTRWCIRKQTFAHVLVIDKAWPPVYAKTFASDGPMTVLTFQSSGDELEAFSNLGHPFYRPVWRPGIVGTVLDTTTDWAEIAEVLTESYCLLAPQKLVAQLNRPGA
jgi:hypothetical protein